MPQLDQQHLPALGRSYNKYPELSIRPWGLLKRWDSTPWLLLVVFICISLMTRVSLLSWLFFGFFWSIFMYFFVQTILCISSHWIFLLTFETITFDEQRFHFWWNPSYHIFGSVLFLILSVFFQKKYLFCWVSKDVILSFLLAALWFWL